MKKKVFSIIAALILALGICLFPACADGGNGNRPHDIAPDTRYTVYFDPGEYAYIYIEHANRTSWDIKVEPGAVVENPEQYNPTKRGYTFDGWAVGSTGGNRWDSSAPVESNLRLYARWIHTPSKLPVPSDMMMYDCGSYYRIQWTPHYDSSIRYHANYSDDPHMNIIVFNPYFEIKKTDVHYKNGCSVKFRTVNYFNYDYYVDSDLTESYPAGGLRNVYFDTDWAGKVEAQAFKTNEDCTRTITFYNEQKNSSNGWTFKEWDTLTLGKTNSARPYNKIPTKDDNYAFKGWYADEKCTTRFDFSADVQWDAKAYAGYLVKPNKVVDCNRLDVNDFNSENKKQELSNGSATTEAKPMVYYFTANANEAITFHFEKGYGEMYTINFAEEGSSSNKARLQFGATEMTSKPVTLNVEKDKTYLIKIHASRAKVPLYMWAENATGESYGGKAKEIYLDNCEFDINAGEQSKLEIPLGATMKVTCTESVFYGWYVDGELISEESTLEFNLYKDTKYFTKKLSLLSDEEEYYFLPTPRVS